MEPQQSPLYATYMNELHWQTVIIDGVQIYLKKFPFRQGMVKIHRPLRLPDPKKLVSIFNTYQIGHVVIEPIHTQNQDTLHTWVSGISKHVKISSAPYLPTKTILIPLNRPEEVIFSSFSEAKRRAVRRANSLGVKVSESHNMDDLIRIKNASAGLFGFMTTTGMKPLWNIFSKENAASILLAHDTSHKLIGGVLLLHWDHVTYYWIAGTIKYGKKLFAPTLLVWESIKLAQKHKSTQFDFVGIWDERIPHKNLEWKGFTKFKEGFGGESLYYPLVSH